MSDRGKKPESPQEEGAPAWMNTYGDMITLVLTFFVLLFSFSTIDALKWKELVSSLSGTPFVAIQALDPGGSLPQVEDIENPIVEMPEPTPEGKDVDSGNVEVKERFDELYEKIKGHISEHGLEHELYAEESNDTILIRMTDSALFDSGQDSIRADAELILTDICEILKEYVDLIQLIQIEGHTDNRPISNARFKDNRELSGARALQVVWFFENILDIDPAKIEHIGKGEYHPIASNDTEEGKQRNRRVDFLIESINKN